MYVALRDRDAAVTHQFHDSKCVRSRLSQPRSESVPKTVDDELLREFQFITDLLMEMVQVRCRVRMADGREDPFIYGLGL